MCVSFVHVCWLVVFFILVLHMISHFLLYPGYFGFNVLGLWILSLTSVLEDSSDTCTLEKGESLMQSGRA